MTIAFSFEQQSIIDGSLLGDGHLSRPRTKNSNSYFEKCQTARRREYLDWTHKILGDYSSSVSEYDNWAKGKKYRKSNFLSHALPVFKELRKLWYPEDVKIVPKNLVLNSMSIAIWFFDDGYNNLKHRRCVFSSNNFSNNDCLFLCNQLKNFNIDCFITSRNEIQVRTESYKTLIDMIRPYMIWPFFEHKIRYRDSELKFTTYDESVEITNLYFDGWTQQKIAQEFGKSISCISNILRGKRKVSVSGDRELSLKNTSGIKGISWDKTRDKWKVSKKVNGKTINIGRFKNKEDALMALEKF